MTDSIVTRRHSPGIRVAALVGFVALPLAVGALGALATTSNVDGWYADANTAPWTPPNAVFGPVWTVLYIAMGVAAWMAWLRRDDPRRRPVLTLFGLQLAANAVWTPLFFASYPVWGTAALWIGMVDMVLLIFLVIAWLRASADLVPLTRWLILPYLAWLAYASTLNLYAALYN